MEQYLMPERIFEQNGSIWLYYLETDDLPVLDSNKWNLVGKMVERLSKFEEIARRFSKRESIVSEIIPNIRFILDPRFKSKMFDSFNENGSD